MLFCVEKLTVNQPTNKRDGPLTPTPLSDNDTVTSYATSVLIRSFPDKQLELATQQN
jgi:hypothetical protein